MRSPTEYQLPYAQISWQGSDTPYANQFEDVYWSASGGLEEKQHVFLDGCDVLNRWQALGTNGRYTIVETGFGFGLNFLTTLRAWQSEMRPTQCRLDYIAYEQFLVHPDDLRRMAQAFGLEAELGQLLKHYPRPVPGSHSIWVSDNCCLHLVVGEIHDQIETLDAHIDAIYLDGFSPSKNESMWDSQLLNLLTARLRSGARLATYSVAGSLRRTLEDQGLKIEKAPGFGRKRHMLIAEAPGQWQAVTGSRKKILVIGAGLTGLLCSSALNESGHDVTLIDRNPEPLGALRDIEQIAIYPQLSKTPQLYSNFYLRAYQYFLRHQAFHACGRIDLLDTEEKLLHGKAIAGQLSGFADFLDIDRASELVGMRVEHPALHFSDAGWMAPTELRPGVPLLRGEVTTLKQSAQGWFVELEGQDSLEADVVVCATGPQSLAQLAPLDLMPLRGQSVQLKSPDIAPRQVLSGLKTWFPISNGLSTVSGTYDRFDRDLSPREMDTEALVAAVLPFLKTRPAASASVGIRSATRDRMPVVDQLPDWQALNDYCQQPPLARQGFKHYARGLFCAVGFGSHGGTLGPYCAELLARKISNDPIAEDLQQLSSTRFTFRDAGIKPRQ